MQNRRAGSGGAHPRTQMCPTNLEEDTVTILHKPENVRGLSIVWSPPGPTGKGLCNARSGAARS